MHERKAMNKISYPYPIRTVISDWCGTIENNSSGHESTLIKTCQALKIPQPGPDEIKLTFGMSHEGVIKFIFDRENTNRNKQQEFSQLYNKIYANYNIDLIATRQTLKWLKENTIFCLFTNGGSAYVEQNLRKHNLENYFHEIATASHYKSKPNPEMLLAIAKKNHHPCRTVPDYWRPYL